jgi:hypothetical protein
MPLFGEKKREHARKWIAKRRCDYFKDKKCAFCGSVEKLELHHLDPTKKEASAVWSWSEEHRNNELDKCIVLCETCHKIETARQLSKPLVHGTRNAYRKKGCRCQVCKDEIARLQREYRNNRK